MTVASLDLHRLASSFSQLAQEFGRETLNGGDPVEVPAGTLNELAAACRELARICADKADPA